MSAVELPALLVSWRTRSALAHRRSPAVRLLRLAEGLAAPITSRLGETAVSCDAADLGRALTRR